jgi:hypothetical protein
MACENYGLKYLLDIEGLKSQVGSTSTLAVYYLSFRTTFRFLLAVAFIVNFSHGIQLAPIQQNTIASLVTTLAIY